MLVSATVPIKDGCSGFTLKQFCFHGFSLSVGFFMKLWWLLLAGFLPTVSVCPSADVSPGL